MSAARRRILMTTDAVGGVWNYAISLARGIAAHGYDTLLAVLGPQPSGTQRAAARGLDLVVTGLPLDWTGSGPAATRASAAQLAALAVREDCALVQLNSPLLAAGARFAMPVVAVAHGCVATWWAAARTIPLAPGLAWHREMTAEGLRRCDLAIAPSAAFAGALRSAYGVERAIAVVHNGRAIPPAPARSRASARFAFTAGRLWDEAKHTALLDSVAARLRVPFRAAGSLAGPGGERVEPRHLDHLGVLSQAQLTRWLAARPVFVSAASFEPFGLAVLEAAQAGCPLVLSDIPTFRELWDGAATFVAPGDAAAFAATLNRLFADPAARARCGALAQEHARRYSLEAMAARMARRYGALLEQKLAA